MKAIKDHYFVTVMEDTVTSKIIAMSSLAIELKFIHNCGLRGRLEDVVVHEAYRGKYLGKAMVRVIIQLARRIGCYKLTLDCKDKYITFYESMGFQCEPENSNTLAIRF
ncbi:putative glucosamine 6-phosphate N-acetyltransferase-like [Tropilaelaps mercedesae]|uniref:Glucosamine 6-phosphate N-acetyltransferase n=1 Tax=Tropilaelaps mercedesae TaxID=418985 RepID=A0A1V9X5N5_9ACAR|nr:putative glucosamine 6-phosphate N-acetyltransferase-like [Tropilaelaps mercedesae]